MSMRFLLVTTLLILSCASTSAQDPRASIKAGNMLVSQEKYELAIREYERVTPKDKETYAQATYNIGVCYFELYLTERAVEYFNLAVELKRGRYPKASYALGVALEEQDKLNEANAAYYEAALASNDDYAAAIFRQGVIAAKQKRPEDAIKFFRAASKHRGPHLANSLNNLGVILARTGKLAEAENAFVSAVRESNGTSIDAEQNLKLCRSMLLSAANYAAIKELVLTSSSLHP